MTEEVHSFGMHAGTSNALICLILTLHLHFQVENNCKQQQIPSDVWVVGGHTCGQAVGQSLQCMLPRVTHIPQKVYTNSRPNSLHDQYLKMMNNKCVTKWCFVMWCLTTKVCKIQQIIVVKTIHDLLHNTTI